MSSAMTTVPRIRPASLPPPGPPWPRGYALFALTGSKFYGTWGDTTPLRTELTRRVAAAGWLHETQHVAGVDVLRIPRLPRCLDRRERLERALLPGAVKWRLDQRRRRQAASSR